VVRDGPRLGRVGDRDVVVSGGGPTVRLWDAGSGQPLGEPLTGHDGAVRAAALGRVADRDVVVSSSWDGTVRACDARTMQVLQALDLLGPARTLVMDSQALAVAVNSAVCALGVDSQAE
jgi:WD40 repeat protein